MNYFIFIFVLIGIYAGFMYLGYCKDKNNYVCNTCKYAFYKLNEKPCKKCINHIHHRES